MIFFLKAYHKAMLIEVYVKLFPREVVFSIRLGGEAE